MCSWRSGIHSRWSGMSVVVRLFLTVRNALPTARNAFPTVVNAFSTFRNECCGQVIPDRQECIPNCWECIPDIQERVLWSGMQFPTVGNADFNHDSTEPNPKLPPPLVKYDLP